MLAPHLASASTETRTKMALMAVENTIALFDGGDRPHSNPAYLDDLRHDAGHTQHPETHAGGRSNGRAGRGVTPRALIGAPMDIAAGR